MNPSDLAPTLAALDAKIKIVGKGGERIVPITDFYITFGTVLNPPTTTTATTLLDYEHYDSH